MSDEYLPPHECPKCGDEIESGFGLAYGGYGSYWCCANQACDWYHKEQEEDE